MAGQKITKRQFAKLAKIGEEVIFDVYVQTRSVAKCIEALDLKMGKTTFYRWLNSDEERRARWNENMKRIAQDLVEESLEIAHGVTDKDDVPAARLKVETNRWTATKYDRVKFGDTRRGWSPCKSTSGISSLMRSKSLTRSRWLRLKWWRWKSDSRREKTYGSLRPGGRVQTNRFRTTWVFMHPVCISMRTGDTHNVRLYIEIPETQCLCGV